MSDSNDNLIKWLNGELSDQDVINEVGEEDFAKYHQILSEINQWKPSTDNQVFEPSIILNKEKKGKTRFLANWQAMSIAAGLLMIMAFGYLFFNGFESVYETQYGQVNQIALPDGASLATLGPNSNLRLRKKTWKKRREIKLEGKAYFEVVSGSPFIVSTPNGQVEVLGTKFDVNHFDESIMVTCYEGKVRATGSGDVSKIVVAGESILYHNGKWEKKKNIEDEKPFWIQNEVKFIDAPITLVIRELKAVYGISVDAGNADLKRRFTGSFPIDNLGQALEIVFGTLGIEYQIDDKKVTLSE